MDNIILTPLKQITHPKGNVFHAMKKSDDGYDGFGEAYFTTVYENDVKGWKKHNKMTLNLVVPVGSVEFVIYDGVKFESIVLSQENYQRLTVKPGLWVAFCGRSDNLNLVLNLASIEHDPDESDNLDIEEIHYAW